MNFYTVYSNLSSCVNEFLGYSVSITVSIPYLGNTTNTMEREKVYLKQKQLDSKCWNSLALNKQSHHLCLTL